MRGFCRTPGQGLAGAARALSGGKAAKLAAGMQRFCRTPGQGLAGAARALSGGKATKLAQVDKATLKIAGINFPDLIEHWNRDVFKKTGAVMTVGALGVTATYGVCQESIIVDLIVAAYWAIGIHDMNQKPHTVLRNFPVLGNVRFLFESVRPEIQQYFIESDTAGVPFSRLERSLVYQRSKGAIDTLPFGTRRNVNENGYEWAQHSMYPQTVDASRARVQIGNKDCKQPYSAALLNISGMSYGALSDTAIAALNEGAKLGGFSHNTGEGGVSRFHLQSGGDLVWNLGTGYFSARNQDGTFSLEKFTKMATLPNIKMIEIKLSQGAKPGHGGLLPGAKVTPLIAEARGVEPGVDCHSPASHSAFKDSKGLVKFIKTLRDASGGKPVGFKLCVGRVEEFCAIIHACIEADTYPDFITVDGGEGGTGAAPPEFSNSVGTPLREGLTLVQSVLIGAGVRQHVKIICSGKVTSGFSIVRLLALGADTTNAARSMMFALGCIQAGKCNSNRCPSGVATQDPELFSGLDVQSKSVRVATFQNKTVENALHIVGAMGHASPSDVKPGDIYKRIGIDKSLSFAEIYPTPAPGSLLRGEAPRVLQQYWQKGVAMNLKAAKLA